MKDLEIKIGGVYGTKKIVSMHAKCGNTTYYKYECVECGDNGTCTHFALKQAVTKNRKCKNCYRTLRKKLNTVCHWNKDAARNKKSS